MTVVSAGSLVVLVHASAPPVVPAAALAAIRAADAVYAAADIDAAAFGVERAPGVDKLLTETVVLVSGSLADPGAAALIAAGALVLETPAAPLVEAAELMDRLRSPGGCPWDAVQTHESLRQYLVEETYELLEAIEEGDDSQAGHDENQSNRDRGAPAANHVRSRGRARVTSE